MGMLMTGTGNGHVMNLVLIPATETATTIQEDPRAAHQRYKDALKGGFVSAHFTKILIIGSAGVGKTHLFHLLSNTPPPDVRQSTPVMKRPVQVIQTTLKSSSSLKSVTDQELYELLASTVNKAAGQYGVVGSSTPHHVNVTTPDPSSQRGLYSQHDMRPSSQGCIHEYYNDPSLVHGVEVPHVKSFQDSSNDGDPSMLHKLKETHMKIEHHSLDNGIPTFSEVEEQLNIVPFIAMTKEEPLPSVLIPNIELSQNDDPTELEQELIPYIAKTKDAAPLGDIDWVYFIDSGGQPEFLQLLPAFIHHTHLNIFVLRLCDKLSDHPTVEYYDERSTCLSSTASLMTNKEILQCCAQATQTADQDGDSRLLIVGTHRDQEDQCKEETREEKNEQLLELLTSTMKEHVMPFTADGSQLIFPLNTKNPSEVDREITSGLLKTIASIKESMATRDIPLKWLVFYQEMQSLSKKSKVDFLTLQQCLQVARRLHMVDDTTAALQFFSELSVILYYSSVLPNVIFTNPQVLLDTISEIIKCVAFDRTQPHSSMLVRASNEGIITEELLEHVKLKSSIIYKEGVIEPKNVMDLMVHLKVASKCENGNEYFMPALLKSLDVQGIQEMLSSSSDSIAPMALHYKRGWFKCGSFAFLITSLLSSKQWTLATEGGKLLCVHSNCITMSYEIDCMVTLVDNVSHIEVHITGDVDICRDACPMIKLYLMEACEEGIQIAFVCPCKDVKERHLAIPTDRSLKYKKVVCSMKKSVAIKLSDLGVHAEVWLGEQYSKEGKSRFACYLS